MNRHPMREGTLARRRRQRREALEAGRRERIARLADLVRRDGPGSLWADMLAQEQKAGGDQTQSPERAL